MTQPGLTPGRDRPFVGRSGGARSLSMNALGARGRGRADGRPRLGRGRDRRARLVLELARTAEARGALVAVRGLRRAVGADALLPLAGVLRRASEALPPGRVEELCGQSGAALAALVPELSLPAATHGRAIAETARARLFEAVARVLSALARERGSLVVAIEDLQWADRSTLDVLRFLVRAMRDERLLLVLTCRTPIDMLGPPARDAFADIARSPRAVFVELHGFDEAAVQELLAALLGGEPEAGMATDVAQRSSGNPFFVERLAEHIEHGGAGLPHRLREALLASTDGLDPVAAKALDALALTRGEISHDALAAVAGVSDEELDAALRAAVGRGVVTSGDGTYAIRHALLQEAVAARILPGEARSLHRALAEQLEGGAAGPSRLAHHWMAAGVAERALPAAVAAAEAAAEACAFPEAHEHFEAALALLDEMPEGPGSEDERGALLAASADQAAAAGLFEPAARRYRDAVAHAGGFTPARWALLHERLAFALFRLGDLSGSLEAAQRAIDLARPLPRSAERARVLARSALVRMVSVGDTSLQELCEDALADARAVGAQVVEAEALIALGTALDLAHGLEEAIACYFDAVAIARDHAAEETAARACLNVSWVLCRAARLDEAAETAAAGVERAIEAGLERAFATALRSNGATALILAGRLEEASALASTPIPQGTDPWAAVEMLVNRAVTAHLRGDDDSARAAIARARARAEPLERGHDMRTHLAVAEVTIAVDTGDPGRALECARTAVAEARPADRETLLQLCAVGLRSAAEAMHRATATRRDGEAEAARRTGMQLVERAHEIGDAGSALGRAQMSLLAAEQSRLEPGEDAESWGRALAAWSPFGPSSPLGAYASFRFAEALAAGRAPAREVRAATLEAVARSEAAGPPCLRGAVGELARRRRVVADPSREGSLPGALARAGLTRREVEVLRLLLAGKSNRQIAAELVISEKTAGHHVGSILAKLGVSSRGEAAALARHHGFEAAAATAARSSP